MKIKLTFTNNLKLTTMKKFLTSILCLLIAGSVYANCSLYIEDFEIRRDRLFTVVPVKVHFDHYVSGVQLELKLPQGLMVSLADECSDLVIEHCDRDGVTVDYMPMVGINSSNTTYIVLSMESDYYNGQRVGVAKYAPGDYVFFNLTFDAVMDFKGGDIEVSSLTCAGADSRPWVNGCVRCETTTMTHVTVQGVTPDEPDPVDPHDVGYWLVVGSGASENYIHMEKNYTYVRLINDAGEENVTYHFRINGVDYGAPQEGRQTDLEDLYLNPLFKLSNNYNIQGGHQYLLAVMGYPGDDVYYLHAHYADGGGYDDIPEIFDVNDKVVKDVRYFNINGQEMSEPNGITIVVTTYTDGSRESSKVIKH